ncbi:MAG: ferritin-like domain-containing protein, partial [Deltaproteobacteria bacterium]|nr:ferritin-like domain-containing protein [Deltaproteobacteria bacterium]
MIDLGDLGLDEGAHLLIGRALSTASIVDVIGSSPNLGVDLPAWCRSKGHSLERTGAGYTIVRSDADRTVGAERAGTIAGP